MVAILDHNGQPIERKVLDEQQTARLGALYQEFATHPSRGLTPAKLARILEEAEQGDLISQCDLFEDMEEKDGHIFSEMSKRRRALLGLDWDIVPPRNPSREEEKAAELIKEILLDIEHLDDVLLDMGDAIGKAYSCQELEWQRLGREWIPRITYRPANWFMTWREDRNQLRLRDGSTDGAALLPFGWITHVHKAKSGYLGRAGLHRVLAWPFLFKNYSLRDLAEFLEIYGLPLRLGTYPRNATDTEKATLLRAVLNIGHAAAGIVPEGMAIEFKEAAKGAADPFQAMLDWCERTQSKAILGGTLTSQADGKSSTNALGNVHNEVRRDLQVADARQFEKTLTRDLVYPLAALNTAGITSLRRSPRWVFDTRESEDIKLLSEAVPLLVNVGMRIPTKWLHEKARIPEPDQGEEVLQPPQAAAPAALRRAIAALRAAPPQDVADAYANQLDEATAEALAGLIEPVRRLVMESDSLEALRDRLIALAPELPIEDLAGTLQRALAAAELAGRYEVNEGK